MKIYKPFIDIVHQEDIKLIKKGKYPELFNIYNYGGTSLFSTKEKAIKSLKEKIKDYDEEIIIQIGITTESCDNNEDNICYFFNNNIDEIGMIDWNNDRVIDSIDYKKGDWTYFIYNNTLVIGMIGWEAEGKEPYYIIFENNTLSDCSPHGHTDPLYIWKSISETEAKKILPWKYFRNIQMRYQEFTTQQKKK